MNTLSILTTLFKRNYNRFGLALGSLIIGAATLATVLGLIGSVQTFFLSESQTLIGGDITIERDTVIEVTESKTLTTLSSSGATFSKKIDTLVVVRGDRAPSAGKIESLLVTMKVVDSSYPLYGELKTKEDGAKIPTENGVFVAPDLLERMGLVLGDRIWIGKHPFHIEKTVTGEPDRVAGSFRLGPLVILSTEGWKMTEIGEGQSRVDHILSIRLPAGTPEARVREIFSALRTEFPRPEARVALALDGPSSLLRVLENAERFFFVMIVLSLFLIVVNIRLNLTFVLSSFQKTIAIMISLGMPKSKLVFIFLGLLFILSIFAGILGTILGNFIGGTLIPYAGETIGATLPAIPIASNALVILTFTLFLCLFSALGFLLRVTEVNPKILLSGYGAEHTKTSGIIRELPVYVVTLFGLFLAVWYLTQRAYIAAIAVLSIAFAFLILLGIARFSISLAYRSRRYLPFLLRSIASFLSHQGVVGTTAIASLSIALTSVFGIALLETNMLENLKTDFRKDAPNIYLIDIQKDQLPWVKETMGSTWEDFSIVRGRFLLRNSYNIQENLATEDPEMRREFNLTARKELIEGEKLISGTWHGETGTKEVSLEKEFAERAKLSLGDQITFLIQGVQKDAIVTSLREVNETNGLPFFFLVFSPDVLAEIPATHFGYAYVPEEQIPVIQNTLAQRYPNISSIPTTQILETIQSVVGALSVAVIATSLPALTLGFLLIIAMLALSQKERSNDMLVFTSVGARMKLLFSLFLIESTAVVCVSGIFSALIAHIGIYFLQRETFGFTEFYFSKESIWIFLGILFLTILTSLWYARKFFSLSPAELLRKN